LAGKFHYSDEHLIRDIADDERLSLFVVEHQMDAALLQHADAAVVTEYGGEVITEAPEPVCQQWIETEAEAMELMEEIKSQAPLLDMEIEEIEIMEHAPEGRTAYFVAGSYVSGIHRWQMDFATVEEWMQYYREQASYCGAGLVGSES